jgi:hypothetical protein
VKGLVLEMGLEDWIPLPEAVATAELRQAVSADRDAWVAVSDALKDLVLEGRVRLYRGRWDDDDPRELSEGEALKVLGEEHWYAFHTEDPEEERVWFVNAQNIRDPDA